MSLLPKLVTERPSVDVPYWPVVYVWHTGVVIVEEMSHVLIGSPEYDGFKRYEWAALSDFPKADIRLTGTEALAYILNRLEN